MNLNHLWAVTRKEFYHILREPATLLTVTVGPLFLLIIFVYAMTSDVRDVPVAVIDHAGNERAAALIERLDATQEIDITERLDSMDEANARMDRNEIRTIIILPQGYGEVNALTMLSGIPQVEIIIDGTEPTSAEQVLERAYTVTEAHMRDIAGEAFENVPGFDASLLQLPVKIESERRYNPDLRPVVDFYPGLAAMVLSLPAVALVVALTREHELGTMEQLVATPLNKWALMTGKIMPYLVFGMVGVVLILLAGRALYDVPFRGSVAVYLLLSFFFLFSNMGLGLLISVFLRSQQVAMIVAMLVFFVPGFFLSGIFFPLWAMPWIVRVELQMLPITHYVTVSESLYLQGTTLGSLWFNAAALIGLSLVITAASVALFRKKVA